MPSLDHRLCVAPMMTHTDRHFRYLLRLISPHVMLYTEMITTGALIYGDSKKYLLFHPSEHPLGIQLGGNNPKQLSQCAIMAEDAGYDEINLNIGCPSDRVQSGKIGACLMAEPKLVNECVSAMRSSVSIPITIKTRLGIDNNDSYEYLNNFIRIVAEGGCKTFIIHARKAWLNGLSPRQNREVPPLKYEVVHQIKKDLSELEIVINGGFTTEDHIHQHLQYVDGVMIGRAVCNNPYILAGLNQKVFDDDSSMPSRHEVLEQFKDYIEDELINGTPFKRLTRNILGMFQGQTGARAFRRYLSEHIYKPNSGTEVLEQAIHLVKAA